MRTLTIAFCLLTICIAYTWSMSDEKLLIKHLTENYRRMGKDGRPVVNSNNTLNVNLGLSLQHILDVDYRSQTMEVIAWLNMNWNDEYLKWNPADFGGVETVRFPARHIFLPDITAYNSASKPESLMDDTLVAVVHNGLVLYIPAIKQRFLCTVPSRRVKRKDFTCSMKYGSWTHDAGKMNVTLQAANIDTSSYSVNPNWELVSSKAERHVKKYDCCPESYIDITFNVTLKKQVMGKMAYNEIQ